jgi:hypothetical protein
VDGGAKAQVFLYPPTLHLNDSALAVGIRRDRVAYVIRNARPGPQVGRRPPEKTLSIAGRAIDSLIQTQGVGDLYRIYMVAKRGRRRARPHGPPHPPAGDHVPITELDARKATGPPRFEVKAPAGAPTSSSFSSTTSGSASRARSAARSACPRSSASRPPACATTASTPRPSARRRARPCSPGATTTPTTRGAVMELATAFPGYTGVRPRGVTTSRASSARTATHRGLRQVPRVPPGRSRKRDRSRAGRPAPASTSSTASSAARRTSGRPRALRRHHAVERRARRLPLHRGHGRPGDRWMQRPARAVARKPFYVYFAPGAAHAPHHAPKEWIAKYKGKFDQGWDGCARRPSRARRRSASSRRRG